MIGFRAMHESEKLIVLSDDMKKYAEDAYEKSKAWLRLQRLEGISTNEIYDTLLKEPTLLFQRKLVHEEYKNPKSMRFFISSKTKKSDEIRFDGGFDSGSLDKITVYFTSNKLIDSFEEPQIKKDFIKRIYHEMIHGVDPINNDPGIRKELDVDSRMQDLNKNGIKYHEYLMLPWELKANLSTMAEIALEYMFSKKLSYVEILKDIENWLPKISHPDFEKEKEYYKEKKHWSQYKEFMKKLLAKKLKEIKDV